MHIDCNMLAFASVSAAQIRAELYWNLGVGFMLSFFGHPRAYSKMATAGLLARCSANRHNRLSGTSDSRAHRVGCPLLTEESGVVESRRLGRSERQIVEAVYRLGEASVADVRRASSIRRAIRRFVPRLICWCRKTC